jgi:hypothetical protein
MKKILSRFIFAFIFLGILACKNSNSPRDSKGRENFDYFISKFYADIQFQMDRIDFPITGKIQENGLPKIIEKEEWKILKPIDKKSGQNKVINIRVSDDLIRQQIIINNAYSIVLEFTLNPASKEWYLSSYPGMSTVRTARGSEELMLDSTGTVKITRGDSTKTE